MTCGIYMITNKYTGQKYIGQSVDIERRWLEHISKGKDKSYIDRAINKYGKDDFVLTIIEKTPKEELNDKEKYWIEHYNTYNNPNHYNLTLGGESNPMDNIESRKKISKALSNRVRTKKHALNLAYSRNSTGFLHVTKDNYNTLKQGFRWVYRCKKDNHTITLTSTSIEKLKQKVINQGFEWKILNQYNADKSLKEEKNILGNKRNTSGYYHVSKQKSSSCKQGFKWVYWYMNNGKYKTISCVDINELKAEVEKRGLIWRRV